MVREPSRLCRVASLALLVVLAAVAPLVPTHHARGEVGSAPRVRLPVHVSVVHADGVAVADADWLESQLRTANEIFAGSGIVFQVTAQTELAERHADIVTRRDRHRLGAYLGPDVIHMFVVRTLYDVDEPGRERRGVHWRPRGYGAGKHFVIVSRIAGPKVLAHELGHFFGNRRHPPNVRGNIMSYEQGPGPARFDSDQRDRIARTLRRFLRTGELVPLTAAND